MIARRVITIHGLVQGVGFRPFVFGLASALHLRGRVQNSASGVSLDLEGDREAIERLIDQMVRTAPPLASIESITTVDAQPVEYADLRIAPSDLAGEHTALVSADAATCDDCLAELFDPTDRRFRHPFITCTNCGPRLTIVQAVPYDRARTTMAQFAMCGACRREYEDPLNRRFHAQPIACWQCGPTMRFYATPARLRDKAVGGAAPTGDGDEAVGGAAITQAVAALQQGAIVAVKGLGGYHLACDATNRGAVLRLRARKYREAKPFAIMVRDLAAARALCEVNDVEATLLSGPMHPIVLLVRRAAGEDANLTLDAIAPGNRSLGVMLPYTPLHHLLLADVGRPLVLTSGNHADEPIAMEDGDACTRLGPIADAFLVHNRPIATRCDDSVTRVVSGAPTFIRRSRGAAPASITLGSPVSATVLAVGGHLKNTFCLAKGSRAFLSHHIGDLASSDAYAALGKGIDFYRHLFDLEPEVIAHDLHPDYLSTRLANEMVGVEHVAVQHHHAHVVSCLAEHGVQGPVIGVVFDGSGFGSDGAVWGGEFLVADEVSYTRVAHFDYVALPGGDAAVRQPWRMAASYLWNAYGTEIHSLRLPFEGAVDPVRWSLLTQMLERGTSCTPTSSLGRLFDAVASLLGIRHVAQFEAQAAMELENIADRSERGSYPAVLRQRGEGWIVDTTPLIRAVMQDVAAGRPTPSIAGAFHNSVCDFTVDVVRRIRRRTGIGRAALTGGVFQNVLLAERIAAALQRAGLEVLTHRRVPCNDGGLALGQAVVAGRLHRAPQSHQSFSEAVCV